MGQFGGELLGESKARGAPGPAALACGLGRGQRTHERGREPGRGARRHGKAHEVVRAGDEVGARRRHAGRAGLVTDRRCHAADKRPQGERGRQAFAAPIHRGPREPQHAACGRERRVEQAPLAHFAIACPRQAQHGVAFGQGLAVVVGEQDVLARTLGHAPRLETRDDDERGLPEARSLHVEHGHGVEASVARRERQRIDVGQHVLDGLGGRGRTDTRTPGRVRQTGHDLAESPRRGRGGGNARVVTCVARSSVGIEAGGRGKRGELVERAAQLLEGTRPRHRRQAFAHGLQPCRPRGERLGQCGAPRIPRARGAVATVLDLERVVGGAGVVVAGGDHTPRKPRMRGVRLEGTGLDVTCCDVERPAQGADQRGAPERGRRAPRADRHADALQGVDEAAGVAARVANDDGHVVPADRTPRRGDLAVEHRASQVTGHALGFVFVVAAEQPGHVRSTGRRLVVVATGEQVGGKPGERLGPGVRGRRGATFDEALAQQMRAPGSGCGEQLRATYVERARDEDLATGAHDDLDQPVEDALLDGREVLEAVHDEAARRRRRRLVFEATGEAHECILVVVEPRLGQAAVVRAEHGEEGLEALARGRAHGVGGGLQAVGHQLGREPALLQLLHEAQESRAEGRAAGHGGEELRRRVVERRDDEAVARRRRGQRPHAEAG